MKDYERIANKIKEQKINTFNYDATELAVNGNIPAWNIKDIVGKYNKKDYHVLNIDACNGDIIKGLENPKLRKFATQQFDFDAHKEDLNKHGITVRETYDNGYMHFESKYFELIFSEYAQLDFEELYRITKPGGILIIEQVGNKDSAELLKYFNIEHKGTLSKYIDEATRVGFDIPDSEICNYTIEYKSTDDVMKMLMSKAYRYINFSVDKYIRTLCTIENDIQLNGKIVDNCERGYIVLKKS